MKFFPLKKTRLHLEITGRCNLRCIYCFQSEFNKAEKIKKELTTKQIFDLINQSKKNGCRTITITGGEPFTRPDIWQVLDYCKDLKVEILTNTEMLSEDEIKKIGKEYPQVKVFKISIDGFRGHNINRKPSDSKRVLKNFKLIRKYTEAALIANTAITKYSVNELFRLYEVLKSIPINVWRVDLPFLEGRYKENVNKFNVSPELVVGQLKKMMERYFKDKKPFSLEIFNLYKSNMVTDRLFKFNVSHHPCAYSRWQTLCIKPDGSLTFCPSMLPSLAKIRNKKGEINVREAIRKAIKNKFFDIKVKDIEKCSKCRYLNICGSGCRADSLYWENDIMSPDPVACKYMILMEKEIMPILPKKEMNYLKKLLES